MNPLLIRSSYAKISIKYLVRFYATAMVFIYAHFMIQMASIPRFHWYIFIKQLVIGATFYCGLWFITTGAAKRFKWTAFFLYLPTIILSPIILSYFSTYLAIVFLILQIFTLIIFSPWANNAA